MYSNDQTNELTTLLQGRSGGTVQQTLNINSVEVKEAI